MSESSRSITVLFYIISRVNTDCCTFERYRTVDFWSVFFFFLQNIAFVVLTTQCKCIWAISSIRRLPYKNWLALRAANVQIARNALALSKWRQPRFKYVDTHFLWSDCSTKCSQPTADESWQHTESFVGCNESVLYLILQKQPFDVRWATIPYCSFRYTNGASSKLFDVCRLDYPTFSQTSNLMLQPVVIDQTLNIGATLFEFRGVIVHIGSVRDCSCNYCFTWHNFVDVAKRSLCCDREAGRKLVSVWWYKCIVLR